MPIPTISDASMSEVFRRHGPRGVIWLAQRWRDACTGLAAELNTARSWLLALSDEADPRTTSALLDEWERAWGLPDRCGGTLPSTDDERRAALTAKVVAQGSQTPQSIIDICAAAGYTVTITTYSALCYGTGEYWEPMYDEAWAYHFDVVGSGGPIPDWLQCTVNAVKPAHTTVGYS